MNRWFYPSPNAKEHFPNRPFSFSHRLVGEPLLTIGALLQAAHELPSEMIEYVQSSPQAEGVVSRTSPPSRCEIIRSIDSSASWMIFRNMEQLARYDSLMTALLQDLADQAPWGPTEILNPMCFVFLSSPRVLTPFHIDPEHNFLFQVEGTKTVLLNDPVKNAILLESEIRSFYADEVGYRLQYRWEREQSPESSSVVVQFCVTCTLGCVEGFAATGLRTYSRLRAVKNSCQVQCSHAVYFRSLTRRQLDPSALARRSSTFTSAQPALILSQTMMRLICGLFFKSLMMYCGETF